MKAVVYTEYGSPDVLQVTELPKPVPTDDQLLIEVHAVSVNAADWHLLRGEPFPARLAFGLLRPRNTILGADVAGKVVAVGKNIKNFRIGDEVFGDLSGCGWGGFAEFVCASEEALVPKPDNISWIQAAASGMAAVTALKALRNGGNIHAGQKVLINGASGGVGSFAVQIAKSFGTEVTAVCSTRNVKKAKELGADFVIDYTKANFAKGAKKYDLILGANGFTPILEYRRVLTPTGTYVMTGGANAQMMQAMFLGPILSLFGQQKMRNILGSPNQTDLAYIAKLLATGKITPVIDRVYSLSETAEAIRYLEAGHSQGKVMIEVKKEISLPLLHI